jgi:hypothetical protein
MAGIKKVGTTGSVDGIDVTVDNSAAVLGALEEVSARIMTMIGIKAEKYAKALCPVGTPESTGVKGYRGGTLRNSITFNVVSDGTSSELSVGTNVEYAPYVELGTGPYFSPPPEWEQFGTAKGSGIGKGYVRPRPYLRPAIEDHISEYADIAKNELKNA